MTEDLTPGNYQPPVDKAEPKRHAFSYDDSEPQLVAVSIIQAVASVAGVDALSLQPRLYDVIDPDALETLLSAGTNSTPVQIQFEFGQYLVTVTSDNELFVEPVGIAES